MAAPVLLALVGLGATPHHAPPTLKPLATWEKCRSDMGCIWHAMPLAPRRPVGHWTRCVPSPLVTTCTVFPIFYRVKHAHHPRSVPKVARHAILRPNVINTASRQKNRGTSAASGQTELMLITWYGWTGNKMANGFYPSIGWAACGYDLRLGERVSVPGVGVLTCGDRIGFQPWAHIDVYGVPLATGYRMVTVLP